MCTLKALKHVQPPNTVNYVSMNPLNVHTFVEIQATEEEAKLSSLSTVTVTYAVPRSYHLKEYQ